LLLAGLVCWTFGEALWVLWVFVPLPASPNAADAGWYAFAVLTGVGLHLFGHGARADRWVTRSTIAVLATAVCALVGALVWNKVARSPFSMTEKAAVLAYPVLYVSSALVVLQSVTSGSLPLRGNPGMAAVVAGFVFEAVGFILWCPALLDGSYVAGTSWADALFSLGLASMAVGACFARPVPAPAPQRLRRFAGVLPGLTLVALVAVQFRFILDEAPMLPRFMLAGAVALVGASLLVRGRMLARAQVRHLEAERQAQADSDVARKEFDGLLHGLYRPLGGRGHGGPVQAPQSRLDGAARVAGGGAVGPPVPRLRAPRRRRRHLGGDEFARGGSRHLGVREPLSLPGRLVPLAGLEIRPDVETGVVYATAHDVTHLRSLSAELVEARDRALEGSRQKSEFLAMMSHEIRTPLNGVIGMTQLLAETELDPEQRGYADTVNSSGEALLTIINDILDFSKIEAGQIELDLIDFDLRDAMETVGELFAARAHEKGLELVMDLPGDLPACVNGDPSRLRQVLTNLIANAIKFTPKGEIVVSLRGDHAEDGGVHVRFEVRDTGVGIDPEMLPRLFESFTQADSSTTRRYGGSGLGLAICKRLTERMGGEIGATSQPGSGSTFWFTLRLADVRGPVLLEPRLDLVGVRVLVVDDSAANREILEHQLRGWKMHPETAEDGPAALRRMRAAARRGERHELLLLDFNMPGMNGVELARAVSGDPELARVPMILLTSSPGQHVEGRPAGIDTFLTKPVRQSHLFDAVSQSMGGRRPPHFVAALTADPTPEVAADDMPRVLLAEDNPVNQAVATVMLRKRGFEVEVAPDGKVAVEMAAGNTYAVIFMDCQMPTSTATTATREIRRQEAGRARSPIIAMTASAMRGDRELCLAAGMDDYVSKPLRVEISSACSTSGSARRCKPGSRLTPPRRRAPAYRRRRTR
jgi:signal transduction histidine kinase/DNA-binding response OmpR family regulator